MLNLHFIRHGQTNFNAERRVQGQFDSILTETGVNQAMELAPKIAQLGIRSAYTSTYVRARHTAEILIEDLGLSLNLNDDLREVMMGPWQERFYSEVQTSDPENLNDFLKLPHRFNIEGAETFQQVQDRGLKAVKNIIASELAHGEGEILIVSHGAILKTIFAYYAGLPLSKIWVEPLLGNCSHSILQVNSEGEQSLVQIGGFDTNGTIWSGHKA